VRQLLILPPIILLILALVSQLMEIAESTSERTIEYANDMNDALDCAFRGINIRRCSPTLMNTTYEEEYKQFEDVLKNMSTNLTNQSDQIIFSYHG